MALISSILQDKQTSNDHLTLGNISMLWEMLLNLKIKKINVSP